MRSAYDNFTDYWQQILNTTEVVMQQGRETAFCVAKRYAYHRMYYIVTCK